MKKIILILSLFLGLNAGYSQDTKLITFGLSGNYYSSVNKGIVLGIGGKIRYDLNQTSSFGAVIRRGIGAPVFGATEHRIEWDDNISSFTELTFLYQHTLLGINSLFIGSGISYLFGKLEDDTKYFYFSLPLVLINEFRLTNSLYLNIGINGNINKKITLWGLDLGMSIKL